MENMEYGSPEWDRKREQREAALEAAITPAKREVYAARFARILEMQEQRIPPFNYGN